MKQTLPAFIISTALLSGCSSILGKSDYPVTIDSQPSAANYVITNRAGQRVSSGVTPATITLKSAAGYFKGEKYTIELDKNGGQRSAYTLNSTLSGWYWGNLLFGGVIGMFIVDPMTGAMYKLPERVDIPLGSGDLLRRNVNGAASGMGDQSNSSSNANADVSGKPRKYQFAAEAALRKMECAGPVTVETVEAFKEIYSVNCNDGRRLFAVCNGGNCVVE